MALVYTRRWTRAVRCALVTVSLSLLASCDFGDADSLYDPDFPFAPDPVVQSVEPAGSALAGVDVLTLAGQNFSSDPDRNLVYFGATRGTVLEASSTQLRVRPPNTPSPEISIRVAVLGAENFSNAVSYALEAAAESFADIKAFEEPFALASDAAGNIYMSLFSSNVSAGIKKVSPTGVRSDYIATTFRWETLDFAPDGALFGVRRLRALFRFPPGGGAQETWLAIPNTAVQLISLDVDADGTVWTGGNAPSIYRIDAQKNVTETPFQGEARALKRVGDRLYVAAVTPGGAGLWRYTIDASGSLSGQEQVFALSALSPTATPRAVAVAANGDIFLGTDAAPDPIVVIRPDGGWESLYPGIFSPPVLSFAWGPSPYLVLSRGRTSAASADLIRINTRRERLP